MKLTQCVCAILTLTGLSFSSVEVAAQSAASTAEPIDYADPASWLCRPGRQDACVIDLTATVVAADGSVRRETARVAAQAPIDCFYLYPTVSTDPTPNSDMTPDEAERRVIEQQFARFASVCQPYAPSYRQVTLAGLRPMLAGGGVGGLRTGLAYDDVRDAFRHYLANDNDGRGFVLIGHSQGAFTLTELIAQEIDGRAPQDRLVSAILLGATVTVARGQDVGGDFRTVPLCRADAQVGCVITYASFRSSAPPTAESLFGRTSDPERMAACTNPAALAGGEGALHAYLSTAGTTILGPRPVLPWTAMGAAVETPFVSVPGLLTAACATNEHATYLEVTVHGDPTDPRVDDIGGDLTPAWGLHLVDVNVAMGNLVSIVEAQGASWARRR